MNFFTCNYIDFINKIYYTKTDMEENKEEIHNDIKVETKKQTKKEYLLQAIKFLGFSLSAGIIQIGVFTLLNEVAKLSYWPAYLIGLVCSVLWNFTFNRKFTFKSSNNVPIAMLKVFCYYLVFTPLSTLWGNELSKIGWNEYLVLALTMIVNFVTEFLYSKYFVFKEKTKKQNIESQNNN